MVRDKIGSSMTKAQLQYWLENWIGKYVDTSPDTSNQEHKASHPLAAASIAIEEDEANPGYYSTRIYLKPHYQLEGMNISLRLVSRMPK
jgi:type VI secretion system protein ImpC